MITLTKFCKNCGRYIEDGDLFCPDCGKQVPNKQIPKFCPNCGEDLKTSDYFCKNCGLKIREEKKQKESFLDKHKTPIIVIAAILAIAIVSFGAFCMISPTSSQEVQVDEVSFSIPDTYSENADLESDESEDGFTYKSKYFDNGEDSIQIDVMHSSNVDADDLEDEMTGEKTNMLGYDGYYEELSDSYSFTFVKDNRLITVYTSNYDSFNEIEVL